MNNLQRYRSNYQNLKFSKEEYIDKMYELHQILFDYSNYIGKTGIDSIEITDQRITMNFRSSGVKLICVEGDKRIACIDSLNFLSYEEEELSMQFQLIEDNDVVFDIGGNYGWYSIHVAKKFPKNKVFSFEPVPKTYSILKENIELNQASNIQPINIGLSNKKGEFVFYCDPELTVNASLNNVKESINVVEVVCKVDCLDQFVTDNKIDKLDFIKCDIEGAELFALLGAKESLKKFKPKLFVEMLRKWSLKFDYHPNDIIEFLRELGYKCFTINNDSLEEILTVTESTIDTNFVFLHTQNHVHLIKKLVNNHV